MANEPQPGTRRLVQITGKPDGTFDVSLGCSHREAIIVLYQIIESQPAHADRDGGHPG
jgi:hypothetical protein